jgi:rhamnulokinase
VFEEIGVPIDLMDRLVPAGTRLGEVTGAAARATGQGGLDVVAVATHDTASAVAALPVTGPDFAYVSSGTWSLVGIETATPIVGPETFAANVTNELGVAGTVRVLKNVTGLWLLRACRRTWARRPGAGGRAPGYDALVEAAEAATPLRSLVDPDHGFAPDADMPAQIASFCRRTGQPEPRTEGEVARCVLDSLALAYRHVLAQLGQIGPVEFRRVHVVGGGSRNRLLCRLTADATGLEVVAGPAEATALGNLLVQALAAGAVRSLADLRAVARDSVATTVYEPSGTDDWHEAYERFRGLVALREETRGW